MTLIYELESDILKMYMRTKNELVRQNFQKLEHYRQTCRQTDRQTNTQTETDRQRDATKNITKLHLQVAEP